MEGRTKRREGCIVENFERVYLIVMRLAVCQTALHLSLSYPQGHFGAELLARGQTEAKLHQDLAQLLL